MALLQLSVMILCIAVIALAVLCGLMTRFISTQLRGAIDRDLQQLDMIIDLRKHIEAMAYRMAHLGVPLPHDWHDTEADKESTENEVQHGDTTRH